MGTSDYSLSFFLSVIVHVMALLLLGSYLHFNSDAASKLHALAETMTLTLVEDTLTDTPAPRQAETPPLPQPETQADFLRLPQPMPEQPAFADLTSDTLDIPKHPMVDLSPPPLTPLISTPSALPDKTVMPPLSTVLSAQEITDPSSLHTDPTGGMLQGALVAPSAKDQTINPKYPMNARRRGEEGRVILDVLVSKEGTVKSVALISSSGFKELDHAAKEAVLSAQFHPGERNGKAVEASARMTILFQLNQK